MEFRTSENTYKFYWKNKNTEIDYPSSLIGTRTPTIFNWTKMEHLFKIMQMGETHKNEKVIVCGESEFTPFEFMKIVSCTGTRMWIFDRSLM